MSSTPASAMLTTEQAAVYLELHSATLSRWRQLGRGPAYVQYAHKVRYRQADLDAWLDAQRKVPGEGPPLAS